MHTRRGKLFACLQGVHGIVLQWFCLLCETVTWLSPNSTAFLTFLLPFLSQPFMTLGVPEYCPFPLSLECFSLPVYGFLSLFRVSPEMSSSPGSPLLGFLNRIRHFVFPKHLVHCLLWHCGTTLIELFFFLMCLSLVDSELLCLITHFVITCNWYIVDNIFE